MSLPTYLLEPDSLVDACYCPDHGEYDSADGEACPTCQAEMVEMSAQWRMERWLEREED